MRIVTVTSNDDIDCTVAMLQSLRVWHRDLRVTVFALEHGWTDEHAAKLARVRADIQPLAEDDVTRRGQGIDLPRHPIWKLDALAQVQEPVLLIDSQALVLQPIDDVAKQVNEAGWFSVRDAIPLRNFHWGEIVPLAAMARPAAEPFGFGTTVLGYDPAKHGDVVRLAKTWRHQLKGRFHTEQAMLNLAWQKLRGEMPADGGAKYAAKMDRNGRFDLGAAILSFAGMGWKKHGKTPAESMANLWSKWPQGLRMTKLVETEFWKSIQPLPWQWPNQRNQFKHRKFVRAAREKSRSLPLDTPVIVENEMQGYLIDAEVLAKIDRWWAENQPKFAGITNVPTYHLWEDGVPHDVPRWRRQRRKDEWLAMIPRW